MSARAARRERQASTSAHGLRGGSVLALATWRSRPTALAPSPPSPAEPVMTPTRSVALKRAAEARRAQQCKKARLGPEPARKVRRAPSPSRSAWTPRAGVDARPSDAHWGGAVPTTGNTRPTRPTTPRGRHIRDRLRAAVLDEDQEALKRQVLKLESDKLHLMHKVNQSKSHLGRLREDKIQAELSAHRLGHDLGQLKQELSETRRDRGRQIQRHDKALQELKELKRRMEVLKRKADRAELERVKVESQLSQATGGESFLQDVLNNFKEMLENNLQCAVCSEVFLIATTVSCGHTFCEDCIEKWKARSETDQPTCPICRATVEHQSTNLVLDNYIDKVAETFFPPAAQKLRSDMLTERKQLKQARPAASPLAARRYLQRQAYILNIESDEYSDDGHDDYELGMFPPALGTDPRSRSPSPTWEWVPQDASSPARSSSSEATSSTRSRNDSSSSSRSSTPSRIGSPHSFHSEDINEDIVADEAAEPPDPHDPEQSTDNDDFDEPSDNDFPPPVEEAEPESSEDDDLEEGHRHHYEEDSPGEAEEEPPQWSAMDYREIAPQALNEDDDEEEEDDDDNDFESPDRLSDGGGQYDPDWD